MRQKNGVFLRVIKNILINRRDSNSLEEQTLPFPCVGRVLTIHAGFQCAPDVRHKCGTTMFAFCIGFSGERTLSAKRFVSASLAAPEGTADVTSTESQRFRRPTLKKATDAPRSEHFAWTQ